MPSAAEAARRSGDDAAAAQQTPRAPISTGFCGTFVSSRCRRLPRPRRERRRKCAYSRLSCSAARLAPLSLHQSVIITQRASSAPARVTPSRAPRTPKILQRAAHKPAPRPYGQRAPPCRALSTPSMSCAHAEPDKVGSWHDSVGTLWRICMRCSALAYFRQHGASVITPDRHSSFDLSYFVPTNPYRNVREVQCQSLDLPHMTVRRHTRGS